MFHALSEIFFINHWIGGVAILAISFINPTMGVAGLISLGVALALHRLAGKPFTSAENPIVYNTLLVGFSVGSVFGLTVPAIVLLVTSSCLTYVTCWWVGDRFSGQGLPILSIPFVIATSLLYLAVPRYPNLMHGTFYPENLAVLVPYIPSVVNWFFSSLGAILFLPGPWVGLIVAAIMFVRSPLTFAFAFFGFLLGG